ncbi:hypothetical protein FIC_01533 [Flavobacteriaceae bacterium 3519-10]|nr:hypothetical protein FIC_01533 [Flavobacteriaceae bacterium 3519-10]
MKIFTIIFFSLFCSLSAQRTVDAEFLNLHDADHLFADDYGNIYIYRNKDFSFTKYDSLGTQRGKLMFTLPFKIQSVQNPLNIPAFSENAQEIRFYDQNLNERQKLDFSQKFGFIKMAYAEDQQTIWLLEESTKRLLQYNFREDRLINSFPFNIGFEDITDLIVYENTAYILTKNAVTSYNFQTQKLFEIPLANPLKLRRDNGNILVVQQHKVSVIRNDSLKTLLQADEAQIVDKNSASYFEIRGNKLYLYPINN